MSDREKKSREYSSLYVALAPRLKGVTYWFSDVSFAHAQLSQTE